MTLFATSDHHFGHRYINGYAGRPYESIGAADADMIRKWREVVTDGDLVLHLGDFSFYPIRVQIEYRKMLTGDVVLIRGNHDRLSRTAYAQRLGFVDVRDEIAFCDLQIRFRHYPALDFRAVNGWTTIHGHLHEKDSPFPEHINVSVEKTGYRPVPVEDLVGKFEADEMERSLRFDLQSLAQVAR